MCYALAIVGCADDVTGPGGPSDETASATFFRRMESGTAHRLKLEGVSGSVSIRGDATSAGIRVEGTRTVWSDSRDDAEEYLARVSVAFEQDDDEVRTRTVQPSNTGQRSVPVGLDGSLVNGDMAADVTHVRRSRLRAHQSGISMLQLDGLEAVGPLLRDPARSPHSSRRPP